MYSLKCFKKYDIRGVFPNEINEELAYALGAEINALFSPRSVAIGWDARLSSPFLARSLARGLSDLGTKIVSLDLCSTEEIYYASIRGDCDCAVMITASHNPGEHNGVKIILKGGVPVTRANGLAKLEEFAKNWSGKKIRKTDEEFTQEGRSSRDEFARWLVEYAGLDKARNSSLKILADCGHGSSVAIIEKIAALCPFSIELARKEPDGSFPDGPPNPALECQRRHTSEAVVRAGANFGAAFDGDGDRCFFYDEKGEFIESYYIIGLLAEAILRDRRGEKILHDARLYWNTREIAESVGGTALMCCSGHSLIKERMRIENAIFAGETSGHYYFRDFGYCDSGALPMLLVASLLARSGQPLSWHIKRAKETHPCGGEINREIANPDEAIATVEKRFSSGAERPVHIDHLDGLNMEFSRWRFNLRKSNTENLLRLNVEARGDQSLAKAKTVEICSLIDSSQV